MLNVALLVFAATVTDAGTVRAAGALLVSVTTAPDTGATCESVRVQVVPLFDPNMVAIHPSDVMVAGAWRDIAAKAEVPFKDAVKVAVWLEDRLPVEILNVPVVAFPATVTDAAAVNAAGALLVTATTAPDAGAA